jgi:NAD(P)H dehydrogenase (quinone)
MNVLIVAANPNPKSFIFQAIKHFADGVLSKNGKITLLDLYQLHGENLFLERYVIEDYQRLINEADVIVLAYPTWWEMPPAVLVNWIQKVLEKDFAFSFDEDGNKNGLLNNKTFIQLVSLGQRRDWAFLGPINTAIEYCDATWGDALIFGGVGPGIPEETINDYFKQAFEAGEKVIK